MQYHTPHNTTTQHNHLIHFLPWCHRASTIMCLAVTFKNIIFVCVELIIIWEGLTSRYIPVWQHGRERVRKGERNMRRRKRNVKWMNEWMDMIMNDVLDGEDSNPYSSLHNPWLKFAVWIARVIDESRVITCVCGYVRACVYSSVCLFVCLLRKCMSKIFIHK